MKYRFLREVVPVAASSVLLSTACVYEFVDNQNEKNLESSIMTLNLSVDDMDNIEFIDKNNIESITYSSDNMSVIIKLKNNDIYYTGYYDTLLNKYIYTKINQKNKVYIKSN